MMLDKNKNILIVGLGLLGGSYAKALSRKGYKVKAITKDQSSVDYALKENIVQYATINVEPNLVGEADLVIFALYPHVFVNWITEYQHLFKKGAIITDVTGVKGSIVYKIQNTLRDDVEFISAHPMAGKETSGVENSDDSIFTNANYIVVPTEKNTKEAIELCCDLGEKLRFYNVTVLNVEQHDKMIAFLSQLTHCIAVTLMCSNDSENLVKYTGDSFRDLTRIAKINDVMWSELFLLNKDALISEMENFRNTFDELYDAIKNENRVKMREMMKCSTQRRKFFDK